MRLRTIALGWGNRIARSKEDVAQYREEFDSHGSVRVPADAYYGAQTARSLENFPIGDERVPTTLIHALGLVKVCAAEANLELGALPPPLASLIRTAAAEVAAGEHDGQFPLRVWQTGSGTHTHMNVNEVVAGRANELAGRGRGGRDPVHPNDHVNLGQSTNDVMPTAMHVAAVELLSGGLLPELASLSQALEERAAACRGVIKVGRTHHMDAVPMPLSREIGAWARQVDDARERVIDSVDALFDVPLGGTAVGSGLNAPPGFGEAAVERLVEATDRPFRSAEDRYAAQAGHEPLVAVSAALRGLAGVLVKIAGDLRLLASGPRAGLGELILPAHEPGSSIMPGKVNPSQAEALHMVCLQVVGLDAAVSLAGMTGRFQLNDNKPLIAHALDRQITLLRDACASFRVRCVEGMEPDRARIAALLEGSLAHATALAPVLGYDRTAAAVRKAVDEGITLREAVLALELLSPERFDELAAGDAS